MDPPVPPTQTLVAPPPSISVSDYPELIVTAIRELNEPDGSSKRAISNYIEVHYQNQLPPTHSQILADNINILKSSSQLVMFKNSYKLPGSAPPPTDPPSAGTAKRRGRPPKPKVPQPAVAVPVFENTINANATPVVVPVGPVGNSPPPVNGHTPAPRGRGRPRKSGGTPKVAAPSGSGRGRGRPKKVVAAAVVAPQVNRSGRPRGRPRKLLDVNQGVVVAGTTTVPPPAAPVVAGKRRGRPPKAGSEAAKRQRVEVAPKRVRKFSGKPLGRPKKQVTMPTPTQDPDSQLLMAYLDVKAKYDNLQSRVKQSAGIIRPFLSSQDAVNALNELEGLAEVNANVPNTVHSQQPPAEAMPAQPVQSSQPVVIS